MEGSGYGPQNEGAPLMNTHWMGAGAGGGDGVSSEMEADRKERLYLCLEFLLLRVLQSAPPRLACVNVGLFVFPCVCEIGFCMDQD